MSEIELALNRFLGRFGVALKRNRDRRDANKLFLRKCKERGVMAVLDVGANVGQFGHECREKGWTGNILSFEPQPKAHAKLQRAAAGDKRWQVAPACGVGSHRHSIRFHLSRDSVSSSILPLSEGIAELNSGSEQLEAIDIEVVPLDDLVGGTLPRPFGLKIDTQGFELEVLRGASAVLAQTEVVVIEITFAHLYENGARCGEVIQFMEQAGFLCIGMVEAFVNVPEEEVLQVDAVFLRKLA